MTSEFLRVSISFFIVTVFSFAGSCPRQALAQQNEQDTPLGRFVETIQRNFDANQNGLIEESEARNQLKKNFARIDADGNGSLDKEELSELATRLRRRSGPRDSVTQYAVPDSVVLEEDIAYREGSSKLWKLDLAYPKPASEKTSDMNSLRPAIVFIHGGGWRSGDKGGGQWRSLPITYAQRGYVCISVNYRLTGEAPLPACIEDCKNAVRWLRAHAEKYQVDPERIGAYGNSAGAHLVSVLGLAAKDADLEGDGPYQEFSSAVNAVVCSAPPTNFLNWDGHSDFDPRFGKRLFASESSDEAKEMARRCSPITYAKAGVPFLVIHGTADQTVPIFQGDSFVKALKEARADVTYMRIDGAGHGVFGQAGEKTYPAMETFFERTLRGGKEDSTK